jgi:hypothetical protein
MLRDHQQHFFQIIFLLIFIFVINFLVINMFDHLLYLHSFEFNLFHQMNIIDFVNLLNFDLLFDKSDIFMHHSD